MKLNHIALAAAFMAVFAAPAAFAQSTNNSKPLSREAVRSEAITTHKDGTMLHSEVTPLVTPAK